MNTPAPPTTTPDDGGGIKRAGMWFVLIGSLGAILMSWVVFHSLDSSRLSVEPRDSVATTK